MNKKIKTCQWNWSISHMSLEGLGLGISADRFASMISLNPALPTLLASCNPFKTITICMFAISAQKWLICHKTLPRVQTCPRHPASETVFWSSGLPFPDGFQSIRCKSTHPGLWRAMLDLQWQQVKSHWRIIWISYRVLFSKKNFDLNSKTSSAGMTKFHTMYKEKWKGQMQNRKHRV